jgi:hypothetical protein
MYSTKHCWDDQIKEDEVGAVCSAHGEVRNANNTFVGKPEGKRPLGRHKHRWEDNINIYLRELGLDSYGSG